MVFVRVLGASLLVAALVVGKRLANYRSFPA
jgi:hypothetical protein